MNIFRKYISVLPVMMLFVAGTALQSCSDDDTNASDPQIFLERTNYRLGLGQVTIKVAADVAPATDISLPVQFGGSAVEGVDFTVASHQITFKAGQTETEFVVNRVVEKELPDDELTLYVNLKNPPAGYSLGLLNYASIAVLGKNGDAISFSDDEGKVGLSGVFKIGVFSLSGNSKRLDNEETFEFEIVPELTTAVEGEHFELPEGHFVTVPRRRSEGSFTMNMLKVEEGHDIVTLRLLEKEGYGFSNFPTMTIRIAGPDLFTGTWAFKGIVNLDLFDMYGEDSSGAPKCSPDDKITFGGNSYESYTFTPDIKGDFKNYFGTETRTISFEGEVGKNFQENFSSDLTYVLCYKFPGINVNFSPASSNIRDAKVCFRLIEVDGEEVLECTLDDFTPQPGEFGYTIYEMMYDMEWAPYRIHLTRVK